MEGIGGRVGDVRAGGSGVRETRRTFDIPRFPPPQGLALALCTGSESGGERAGQRKMGRTHPELVVDGVADPERLCVFSRGSSWGHGRLGRGRRRTAGGEGEMAVEDKEETRRRKRRCRCRSRRRRRDASHGEGSL